MASKPWIVVATAAVATLGIIVTAWESGARGDSTATFHLGLSVPTICRIEVRDGAADVLTAEEFCNAPAGYRVLALHPAVHAGGPVWFTYGDQRVAASVTGTTLLAEEPGGARRLKTFAVASSRPGGLALSMVTLQIVPR
mgnify:CR=1 FL=1